MPSSASRLRIRRSRRSGGVSATTRCASRRVISVCRFHPRALPDAPRGPLSSPTSPRYSGIVQSYDATSESYGIVFDDGEICSQFRAADVFQHLGAPVPGDTVRVAPRVAERDAAGRDADAMDVDASASAETTMTFVARRLDGGWDLSTASGVAVHVALRFGEVPRCTVAPKPAARPRVELGSIPAWSISALPLVASSTPPRGGVLVRVAHNVEMLSGAMREEITIAAPRDICPMAVARPAVGSEVGVIWRMTGDFTVLWT